MPDPEKPTPLVLATSRDRAVGTIVRPAAGWLRTLREALGLTLVDVARRLKITPPAVRSFEQAEAEDRITLASLRRTADAMGCELIYVLVPRTGSLASLAESERARRQAGLTSTPSSPENPITPPPAAEPQTTDKKVTDLTWRTLHGET
jgi:predicted DNA-binding mobile mystery protein A